MCWCNEGVLTNRDVHAIFGLHVMQIATTGQVAMRPLGAMASSQRFEIVVKGKQTHGAMPWAASIRSSSARRSSARCRRSSVAALDIAGSPAVVTVGTFQSGVRNNIVPGDATLTGTIRTFDPAVTRPFTMRCARSSPVSPGERR